MRKVGFVITILLSAFANVNGVASALRCEGILGSRCVNISHVGSLAQAFLPYNPIVVEVGAYAGDGTLELAKMFPYGRIFAFEPQPGPYLQLVEKTRFLKRVSVIRLAINAFDGPAELWGEGPHASFFNREGAESGITVPCVVLEDWCNYRGITHIDFLRLDAGGLEWQIIESSPHILETVLVLLTKSHHWSRTGGIVLFPALKSLLEERGFTLLAHCYEEGREGEAIFVRKHLYDSMFN
ncbi:MAG: FkbM family methyltransferase [Chlamydiota bacterium]